MEEPKWYPIPEFEGYYEITRCGRIRSLPRWVRSHPRHLGGVGIRKIPGRELRPSPIKIQRYLRVTLTKESVHYHRYIHCLLAEIFIGPRPPGMLVCHNNGKFQDNRIENLRYDAHEGNMLDAIAHGAVARARITRGGEILSDERVMEIRQILAERGNRITAISKELGIRRGIVKGIAMYRTYRHVVVPPPLVPGLLSMAMFL